MRRCVFVFAFSILITAAACANSNTSGQKPVLLDRIPEVPEVDLSTTCIYLQFVDLEGYTILTSTGEGGALGMPKEETSKEHPVRAANLKQALKANDIAGLVEQYGTLDRDCFLHMPTNFVIGMEVEVSIDSNGSTRRMYGNALITAYGRVVELGLVKSQYISSAETNLEYELQHIVITLQRQGAAANAFYEIRDEVLCRANPDHVCHQ